MSVNLTSEGVVPISDIKELLITIRYCSINIIACKKLPAPLPRKTSLMNEVSLLFLFLLPCFASEPGGDKSHVRHLIKTKSGKIFLRRSSKEKDTEAEGGHDHSKDEEAKVSA